MMPEELAAVCEEFNTHLPAINEDDSSSLPMPARFVIGTDGVIAYAEINPDYPRRPDPEELFPVLRRLRHDSAA